MHDEEPEFDTDPEWLGLPDVSGVVSNEPPLTSESHDVESIDAAPEGPGNESGAPREEEAETEPWAEAGSDLGQIEIERAYQKALAVLEDAGWELDPTDSDGANGSAQSATNSGNVADEQATAEFKDSTQSVTPFAGSDAAPSAEKSAGESAGTASGPRLAAGTERQPSLDELEHSNVTPAQVLEAAFFVGGVPLTSKKICALLRNSFDVEFVERTIDELNDQYVAEARPYEIRLGEGGYRLELKAEYEKLRQRAYGSGPREVKLSQDVLEVLALVAYQQPISQEEIEGHGKQNAGNLLRQLLRRDLVAIQRGEGGRKDVRYLTTPRFLTVFGIGSLDELPQPDDLARK